MIGLIIGFVAAYFLIYRTGAFMLSDSRGDKVFSGLMTLILGLGFAMIGSLITSGIAELALQKTDEVVGTKPIVALKDKSEVHGSFFLGTGSIDGELVYYAMVDTGGGAYQPQQFAISEVRVHENSNASPRVDTVKQVFKQPYCWLLVPGCESLSNRTYHFYVPDNAIDRTFKLDMEG